MRFDFDPIDRAFLPRETVFQDECRNPAGGEPPCDVVTFMIHPEFPVSAARNHEHTGSGGPVVLGEEDEQLG